MYGGYDFINYSEPIYRRLANQPLFELDEDYQEYLDINIYDSLIFSFNNNTLPGEYKVSLHITVQII